MVPGYQPGLEHIVDALGNLGSLNLFRSSMNQATNLATVILI